MDSDVRFNVERFGDLLRRCRLAAEMTQEELAERAVYVNGLGEEGEDRVREDYGANYPRLAAIKSRYDPTNVFRSNQNIRPLT